MTDPGLRSDLSAVFVKRWEGVEVGQGISAILTFAIGVAISPVPIIAVILMLFSQRARVNGPPFSWVGWSPSSS